MTPTLSPQSISIWQVFLPRFFSEINNLTTVLNAEELQRAHRYHFALHRNRFIVARAMLRKILSLYLMISPQEISFSLGEHGKPYLTNNELNIRFNLSHSHDMAIYAITQQNEVGIDIEKIEKNYKEEVAKRFFSAQEYLTLTQLPPDQQILAFYHLWARKEAIIKVLGKNIYHSTRDFSLDWQQSHEKINFSAQEIYLQGYHIAGQYVAALASLQPITEINYWEWYNDVS